MEIDEVLYPRGLEAYVPALASLRATAWVRLPAVFRHLFELGDYVGLERAIALTVSDFVALRQRIPGDLWRRCAAVSRPLAPFPSYGDDAVFRADGRPLTLREVLSAVTRAFATDSGVDNVNDIG